MINEIKSIIGDFLQIDGENLQTEKLPIYCRKTLEFLEKLNPGVPKSSLLIITQAKTAQMLSHHRVFVKGDTFEIPANFYGLHFLLSGGGKDKTSNMLDTYILKTFTTEFKKDNEKQIEEINKIVSDEAEKKYANSKAVQTQYIERNGARQLMKSLREGTIEGLTAQRESLQKLNFGATFSGISEFSDFVNTMSSEKERFVTGIIEIFDNGNLGAKATKGDKNSVETENIPNNILWHSSEKGLISGKGREKLHSFFSTGLARRSFVSFPEELKEEYGSNPIQLLLKRKKDREDGLNMTQEIINMYDFAFKETQLKKVFNYNTFNNDTIYNNKFVIDEETLELFHLYELYCEISSKNVFESVLQIEIRNRYWKTVKLAGIIACMNHPAIKEIQKQDYLQAIYQAEFFGNQFKKFFNAKEDSDEIKIVKYLKENSGKELLLSDIKDYCLNNHIINKNYFSKFWADSRDIIMHLSELEGLKIEEKKGKGNSKIYKITLDF